MKLFFVVKMCLVEKVCGLAAHYVFVDSKLLFD